MFSDLDHTLLALLALHPHASGYELHQVIKESTGYMLRASFSQIYPSLNKLHEQGLAEYELEPIKNRPGKKRYSLTDAGRVELQEWLASPVELDSSFESFDLRLAFAPLMPKETLLDLIDAALAWLEQAQSNPRAGGHDPVSFGFLDEEAVDMAKVRLVWESMGAQFAQKLAHRQDWLVDLRTRVEAEF